MRVWHHAQDVAPRLLVQLVIGRHAAGHVIAERDKIDGGFQRLAVGVGDINLNFAVAEEAQQPDEPQAADKQELLGRGFGDMTFTDRTTIWGKVIDAWLEEPKNMVIGFGLGKISAITDGMTTHNAYLGFITNYGLIGFALLCCFFGSMAGPMCRAFFAPKGRAHAGDRVLAMIVVAALLTSLMESEPLGAMSPMNFLSMSSVSSWFFAPGTKPSSTLAFTITYAQRWFTL